MNHCEVVIALERSLLSDNVRRNVSTLNALFPEDFVEFGASGAIYGKQDVLDCLPIQDSRTFEMSDIKAEQLDVNVILLTYKVIESSTKKSLRSSIWVYNGEHWLLKFHQGTSYL